jgi:hypothetical protein
MNSKLQWINFFLSIVAIFISCVAICNVAPRQLGFDYIGVIVGILALLVTTLIGWQIVQYIFAENKMRDIARKASRIIAKKTSQDIAKETAEKIARNTSECISKQTAVEIATVTAATSVKELSSDIALVVKGSSRMQEAVISIQLGDIMDSIDKIIDAIGFYVQCKEVRLSEQSINDAMETLKNLFEVSKEDEGGLRILEGKRDHYKKIIGNSHHHAIEIQKYLAEAKEYPASYESELSKKRMEKMIEELT